MSRNSILYIVLVLVFFLYDAISPYFYIENDEAIITLIGVYHQHDFFLKDIGIGMALILFPTTPFIQNEKLRFVITLLLIVYGIKEFADLLLTNNEYNIFSNSVQQGLFVTTLLYFIYYLINEKDGNRTIPKG